MSKLLARAKVKRENAEHDYHRLSVDDAFVDDCCYNLQQAIEMSLKYIVEMNGENYVENHDVRAQLNKLRDMEVDFPYARDVRHMAATLNSWQTESRYNDSFVGLIEDIDDARAIADEIIEYCEGLVTEEQ